MLSKMKVDSSPNSLPGCFLAVRQVLGNNDWQSMQFWVTKEESQDLHLWKVPTGSSFPLVRCPRAPMSQDTVLVAEWESMFNWSWEMLHPILPFWINILKALRCSESIYQFNFGSIIFPIYLATELCLHVSSLRNLKNPFWRVPNWAKLGWDWLIIKEGMALEWTICQGSGDGISDPLFH